MGRGGLLTHRPQVRPHVLETRVRALVRGRGHGGGRVLRGSRRPGGAGERLRGGGHRNCGGRGRGGGLWRRVLSRLPRKRCMMEARIWIASFCLQVVSWTSRSSVCVFTQSINDLHALYAGCQCVFHEDLLLFTRTIILTWAGRIGWRILSLRFQRKRK